MYSPALIGTPWVPHNHNSHFLAFSRAAAFELCTKERIGIAEFFV
ncbi:hypothetical protein yrohd0001_31660 [Yersinia rohdei ATCC 43380]|nr:hypothetical protein yrohd0001_31660 [Yersinia rohdei ATCC 43380]